MLSPSELETRFEPTSRKPPPRIIWWWQPRFWHVIGSALLVLAVIATHERWRLWIGPCLYFGLAANLWGFSGVPLRELPIRYRLAQIGLLPALVVPTLNARVDQDLTATCVTQPGQRLTAYVAARADVSDVAVVVDYGDGSVFTGTDQGGIKHVYAKAGTYHPRITVVHKDRTESATCTVTVR